MKRTKVLKKILNRYNAKVLKRKIVKNCLYFLGINELLDTAALLFLSDRFILKYLEVQLHSFVSLD